MTQLTKLASALIAVSAGLITALGIIHLVFTFHGSNLHPRDAEVRLQMENALPVLTRETTMWKAWIGFNATHSLGIILFGVMYGYLALAQRQLLFRSGFLLLTGLIMLAAYGYVCRRYFFSVPFHRVVLAGILYLIGTVVGLIGTRVLSGAPDL
jgi:hypothetical protein